MNPIADILDEIFNLGPGAESIIYQALEERKTLNGRGCRIIGLKSVSDSSLLCNF